jgi:phosphatidylglycerophosphate synthase
VAYLFSHHSPQFDRSVLAASEQKLTDAILAALPESVTPLRLTRVGVFGAVIAAAALIGCRWSPAWLPVFVAGMFLNWLGMALDGPLARSRSETNRNLEVFGQTNDLLSQVLLIAMFGASPFLSLQSPFVILVCYLLFSAYNYVRTIAHHARPMAYIGVGPSEFRILMVAWPFVAQVTGVDGMASDGPSRLDPAILILAAFAVIGLAAKALADARELATVGMTSGAPCRSLRHRELTGENRQRCPEAPKGANMCYSCAEE